MKLLCRDNLKRLGPPNIGRSLLERRGLASRSKWYADAWKS